MDMAVWMSLVHRRKKYSVLSGPPIHLSKKKSLKFTGSLTEMTER